MVSVCMSMWNDGMLCARGAAIVDSGFTGECLRGLASVRGLDVLDVDSCYEPLNPISISIVEHEQVGHLTSDEAIRNCGEVTMTMYRMNKEHFR